jgi:hypothetical protein
MGFSSFNGERVFAELVPQESDKESVDIPTNPRASVNDAGTLSVIETMGCIQANLRFAMQAFGGQKGQQQGCFNFFQRHIGSELVSIEFPGHVHLLV